MPLSRVLSRARPAVVLGAFALWLGVAAPAHALSFKAVGSVPLGGTFAGTTDNPVDVRLADVNGDGKLDMVALTRESGVWAYGGGAGAAFAVPSGSFSVGSNPPSDVPAALCTGQLNGAGGADYVVPMTGGTVKIGLQSSGLAFASPPASRTTGITGLTSCAVGDVDGDGDLDVAVGGNGGVVVLTNNGAGVFTAGPLLATSGNPNAVAIGNLKNDGGANDVAAAVGAGVSIFFGGTGAATVVPMTGSAIYGVAIADFDGVNGADLAAGADNIGGSDYVRVRLNAGNGTFGGDVGYAVGAGPRHVLVDDFTKDGIPDLLVSGAASGGLAAVPGSTSPRGSFGAPALVPLNAVAAAASGNLDTDGASDIVSVNVSGIGAPPPWFSASIATNAPGGSFAPATLSFPVVTLITGAPIDENITLTSQGVPNLNVSGLTITGNDAEAYAIIGDGCSGRSLLAGASCQITVRFIPTRIGPSPALLTVLTDAAQNPTVQLVANGGAGARPAAPANIVLPSISGTAEEGKTLTCSPGTWSDPSASFDYFWARGGEGLADTGAQTYTVAYDDVGYEITCRTFASTGGGRVAAISKPVIPVDKIKPICTLKANNQNMATVRSKGFQETVTCSEPVTVKYTLRISKKDRKKYHLRSTKIGSDEQKYTAAGANVNRVLLDATPKRRLKRAKRLRITVRITATDRVKLASKAASTTRTAK